MKRKMKKQITNENIDGIIFRLKHSLERKTKVFPASFSECVIYALDAMDILQILEEIKDGEDEEK